MKKVLFYWFLNVFDRFRPCKRMRKHALACRNTQQMTCCKHMTRDSNEYSKLGACLTLNGESQLDDLKCLGFKWHLIPRQQVWLHKLARNKYPAFRGTGNPARRCRLPFLFKIVKHFSKILNGVNNAVKLVFLRLKQVISVLTIDGDMFKYFEFI